MYWKFIDSKIILHFAFAAALLATIACVQPVQAAALPKFNAFSQSASGLADFEQTVYDRAQKVVQKSKGRFAFARPGKFRWTYDKPAQTIVGDGAKVWIYDADLNQVTVRKFDKASSSTPASLLTGEGKIDALFDVAEQGVQDGIEWLEAKPKKPDTGFDRIRIGFAGDTLAAMELFDQFGTRTLLQFSNLRRNAAPDAALFRFTPPKGADVLSD
jgi:outer membrane lipoprotein carrier protein